jgi:hypothetical protein
MGSVKRVPVEKPLSMDAHYGFHNAEGNVKVVPLTDGSEILTLENPSTNGPNVYVYLCTAKHARLCRFRKTKTEQWQSKL